MLDAQCCPSAANPDGTLTPNSAALAARLVSSLAPFRGGSGHAAGDVQLRTVSKLAKTCRAACDKRQSEGDQRLSS